MTLTETRNPEQIISFVKGKGIMRRCMGVKELPDGLEIDVMALKNTILDPFNTFLLAKDDDRELGFICFYPLAESYAMHICLRTIGEKTKTLIKMAFDFAHDFLQAPSVYWVYPDWARAIKNLSKYFRFTPCPSIASMVDVPDGEDYLFERLDLNYT